MMLPFIHSLIHSFRQFLFKSTTTRRHSRHSTNTVWEFHFGAPQATASEGLVQGPYVVAWAGYEPATLWTKGVESTNEPPRPTIMLFIFRFLGSDDHATFFPNRDRQRVAYEILAKTVYGKKKRAEIGIDRLLEEQVYAAAFPLHDVSWNRLPIPYHPAVLYRWTFSIRVGCLCWLALMCIMVIDWIRISFWQIFMMGVVSLHEILYPIILYQSGQHEGGALSLAKSEGAKT